MLRAISKALNKSLTFLSSVVVVFFLICQMGLITFGLEFCQHLFKSILSKCPMKYLLAEEKELCPGLGVGRWGMGLTAHLKVVRKYFKIYLILTCIFHM